MYVCMYVCMYVRLGVQNNNEKILPSKNDWFICMYVLVYYEMRSKVKAVTGIRVKSHRVLARNLHVTFISARKVVSSTSTSSPSPSLYIYVPAVLSFCLYIPYLLQVCCIHYLHVLIYREARKLITGMILVL